MVVYGVVVPLTVAVVAGAGWYIATGETPADVWDAVTQNSSRVSLPMPARPGAESPADSLMRPPSEGAEKSALPKDGQTATAPQAQGQPQGVPPAVAPPSTGPATAPLQTPAGPAAGSAAAPGTEAPPEPPAMGEPATPPGGEPLTPPTFAQLPARTDLKALAPAPSADLLRNSSGGPLPVIAGTKEARSVYARPFTVEGNPARIAVVVTGLGLSREATEAAISKLPPNVSLSFSPYAASLDTWVKRARSSGHEVLIDLPLEPPNFPDRDAGPLAIQTADGPVDAIAHLEAVLGKATSYVGVASALRSPVSTKEQWPAVLRDIRGRGLLFVGDGLVGVGAADIPAALSVALVADETPFRSAIDARLGRLVTVALRDGVAVTYVSARPVTFERLLAWFAGLQKKGVVLAPVSAVVRPPAPAK